MAAGSFKTKDFISYDLAEWSCGLKYDDLSPEAIERAKLFWFDSMGCALGGSRQEDAVILMAHHRAMSGSIEGRGVCTCFVSGTRANPVDAAFLNGHMIRSMDYNDIYWKADPSHPTDIIPAALSFCEMMAEGSEAARIGAGKALILGTVIGHEIEMRLCEFGDPGVREYGWHHAALTCFASPIVAGRMMGLSAE